MAKAVSHLKTFMLKKIKYHQNKIMYRLLPEQQKIEKKKNFSAKAMTKGWF
jgi:hypothetical protein